MTQIILSESQWAQLQQGFSSAELCDPEGRIVGLCLPVGATEAAERRSPFNEEEVRRRAAEPGGMPLQEAWPLIQSQQRQ
jgi:hypothetical protein